MSPIEIGVRGMHPVPAFSERERLMPWRQHIQSQVRQNAKHVALISERTMFEVELTFYLQQERLYTTDLENLSIPVLNTLFRDQRESPYPRGVLFDVSDSQVVLLKLVKTLPLDPADVGVFIRVQWRA